MHAFIATLDLYFGKKAPHLPHNIKEFIVKIAPYLVILGIIMFGFALIAILPVLFAGSAVAAAVPGVYYPSMMQLLIGLILMAAIVILEVKALPGLFKRTHQSWNFIFYAQLVSLVQSIVHGNLVGFIVGGAIGLYILFQIRPLYTGHVTTHHHTS